MQLGLLQIFDIVCLDITYSYLNFHRIVLAMCVQLGVGCLIPVSFTRSMRHKICEFLNFLFSLRIISVKTCINHFKGFIFCYISSFFEISECIFGLYFDMSRIFRRCIQMLSVKLYCWRVSLPVHRYGSSVSFYLNTAHRKCL